MTRRRADDGASSGRARDADDRRRPGRVAAGLVDRPDVAGALDGGGSRSIVTCRAAWEGGRFDGSEEERRRILEAAVEPGAEYVDVEAAAAFAPDLIARTRGRGIVVSRHVFEAPPARRRGSLSARCAAMGAEVAKLAVAVDALTDVAAAASSWRDDAGRVRTSLLAMGAAGLPSRVLAARLGNRWTYAGDGVAPGPDFRVDRLLDEFQFRRIRPDAARLRRRRQPVGIRCRRSCTTPASPRSG